jgi:hypothetical protein
MTPEDPKQTLERPDSAHSETERSFRERALSGAPNPLERIDHLFRHTATRIWFGVLGLGILLAAGVLWTAVAKETVTADAPAVIVPPTGVFTAGELEVGTVNSVLVGKGTVVRRGQRLALVKLPTSERLVGVVSPIAGRVLAVEVRVGDVTQSGGPMFLIVPRGVRPMAIALFPTAGASQLAVGQSAAVTVHGVSPGRYGKAIGRVVDIERVPVTTQRLKQLTGDSSLSALASRGPMQEVRIQLTAAHTPSGLAWTGGRGPAGPLLVGARAIVSVTVSRETLLGKVFG